MTSLTRNGFSTWGLALAVLMGSGTVVQAAAPAAKSSEPAVATLGAIHISSAEVQQLLRAMPESERAKVKSNREGLENWLRQRLAGEAVLREAQQRSGQNARRCRHALMRPSRT
jgi:peptidylprolyl isomerase